MGGELGNETYMDVLESSALSTKFHLDRERRFLYDFSVKKLVLLSFRGYLDEIKYEKKRKRQKAVYGLVTAPQGGTQKYTLTFAYDSPR